ncbi:MAG: glutamine amidotransferase [Wenzhouxiangellaceae bacterium]
MRELLIIKTGTTLAPIKAQFGDFERWFAMALGELLPLRVIDVCKGETLPRSSECAGLVVTGSPAMVSHREEWSEQTAVWLRQAFSQQMPMLGVCYGHQLLAHALGATVGPNPSGRHMGTVSVTLTEAGDDDPLTAALRDDSRVQVTHAERVLQPPPGAVILAQVAADPYHALRFGPLAWGVQFHPEFTPPIMRAYIEARRQPLTAEGMDADALAAAVTETPCAIPLMRRFVRLCFSIQAGRAEQAMNAWV